MKNFNYKKFLEDKHSQFQTPQHIIDEFAFKASGHNPINTKRIIKGEANEVYEILLDNDLEIIVRISRDPSNPFLAEEWAMKECVKLGVPVADVLLIDEIILDSSKISLCALSKIKGQTLDEIKDQLNNDELKTILNISGDYLSRINSISSHGYGHIKTPTGNAEEPTYYDYLIKKKQNIDQFINAAEKNNLDKEIITKSFELLLSSTEIFKNNKYILAHGDMGDRHIMIHNKKVSGIIDFGNMRSSFPVHDFAWWNIWYKSPHELKWVREGYKNKEVFKDNYEYKFNTIKLLLGLELLYWNNHEGHVSGIEKAIYSINSSLNSLKLL